MCREDELKRCFRRIQELNSLSKQSPLRLQTSFTTTLTGDRSFGCKATSLLHLDRKLSENLYRNLQRKLCAM